MSALWKLIRFIFAAGVMPVLTGLLPVSFLPRENRRLPWLILAGYLTTFAVFEVAGLPILLFTTYGDFYLLVKVFTALDLIMIAAGIFRCVRSGGICLPYGMEARIKYYRDRVREEESGKRYAEGSAAARNTEGTGAGRGNQRTSRLGMLRRRLQTGMDGFEYDPDAILFWIIFVVLLFFELYMAFTTASFDGDDAYYVAQSVQTWQTGTMYYYVPYTGWTTTLDGRHALAMVPIWIAYVATMCGTHPTIVTHSLLPMILIPLVDVTMYCAASELLSSQPGEKQRRMLPAIMILIAVMQIFGNVSIYTPETFLIMRTWQGKALFANLILPAAFALLLRWCAVHHVGEETRQRRARRKPKFAEKMPAGKMHFGKEINGRTDTSGDTSGSDEIRTAHMEGKSSDHGEGIFFWIMVIGLNAASGFCTALAPAILTVLLVGAAFLIAVFLHKGRFLISMLLACIPNYLYLVLLLRTINSQWFSFLQGGRLP